MTAHSSKSKKIIEHMEAQEFNSASEIKEYANNARDLLKAIAVEIEFGAQELEARLKELPPGDGEGRATAMRKAKSVSRHLRKAAKATRSGATESTRTWASLQRQYDHIIKPKKERKKKIDLTQ